MLKCSNAQMLKCQIPNAKCSNVKCSNTQTLKCPMLKCQMLKCSNAQMLKCQTHKCSNTQMLKCQMLKYTNTQMLNAQMPTAKCPNAQKMLKCSNAQTHNVRALLLGLEVCAAVEISRELSVVPRIDQQHQLWRWLCREEKWGGKRVVAFEVDSNQVVRDSVFGLVQQRLLGRSTRGVTKLRKQTWC